MDTGGQLVNRRNSIGDRSFWVAPVCPCHRGDSPSRNESVSDSSIVCANRQLRASLSATSEIALLVKYFRPAADSVAMANSGSLPMGDCVLMGLAFLRSNLAAAPYGKSVNEVAHKWSWSSSNDVWWCIFGENVWPANCSADGSGTEYKHCGKLNELLMKWLHYAFRYCGFCIVIDAFSRDLQTRIWWNSTEKRGANTMWSYMLHSILSI